jgi:hypothetical protein
MMNFCSILLGGLIVLTGCQTLASDNDVPARITNPTDASRAALQNAVNDTLHTNVILANDALTNDSLLIIEPKHLTGRDFGRPKHFRLVLSGSRCVLVHQETEARLELTETTCAAE